MLSVLSSFSLLLIWEISHTFKRWRKRTGLASIFFFMFIVICLWLMPKTYLCRRLTRDSVHIVVIFTLSMGDAGYRKFIFTHDVKLGIDIILLWFLLFTRLMLHHSYITIIIIGCLGICWGFMVCEFVTLFAITCSLVLVDARSRSTCKIQSLVWHQRGPFIRLFLGTMILALIDFFLNWFF